MQSFELTQPVSSAILLKQFESRFGQTMNLQGLDKTQLEDLANSVRTKIHTITDNLHFGKELQNNEYQKSQMMLDILNQAISEYGGGMASSIIGKATGEIKNKLSIGQAVSPADRKAAAQAMKTEGVEEQSELILAAKDMMDKVTGYLEDLASMKTEGMLELADRIRDEMGADKADAFLQKIQPAIDTINTDADLDSLESPEEDDEFGATDAEAGGTEPEGREQRESKEVFEQSNRIYAKLAGK